VWINISVTSQVESTNKSPTRTVVNNKNYLTEKHANIVLKTVCSESALCVVVDAREENVLSALLCDGRFGRWTGQSAAGSDVLRSRAYDQFQ